MISSLGSSVVVHEPASSGGPVSLPRSGSEWPNEGAVDPATIGPTRGRSALPYSVQGPRQWARSFVPGGSGGFGRALPEDDHAGANRALANSASYRHEPNVEACQALLKTGLTESTNPGGLIARVGPGHALPNS
ncbi:hypothetical protein TYRP_022552 [Tyrophagus putrescentiae]|nr:hypothetical protein TYRP_022552 [Tyrophagus putrescentiae]